MDIQILFSFFLGFYVALSLYKMTYDIRYYTVMKATFHYGSFIEALLVIMLNEHIFKLSYTHDNGHLVKENAC